MRTAYEILLSITIRHFHYPDRVFESFELVPNKKTSEIIKDFRLVTKKKNNNWSLFFQTEGPFATLPASFIDKEFLFELKILDSFFFSITDASYLHGNDEILFFNSPLNSIIIPEKREVRSLKFNYSIHHLVRPVNIKVTTAKGAELMNEVLIDPRVKEKEIDLTANGENIYNISEDAIPAGSAETEKIFAREGIDDNFFYGLVYLKILPADADADVNAYQINFEANH